ncbi:hypothetical protein B2J39_18810 [Salmonella enterica]|nr:hypothetical protein [Salmonella enterica]
MPDQRTSETRFYKLRPKIRGAKGAFLMQIIYYCGITEQDKSIICIHILNMFYWNGYYRYDKSLKKTLM